MCFIKNGRCGFGDPGWGLDWEAGFLYARIRILVMYDA